MIKEITKIMYKFLWDNKPDKIKRDLLVLDYDLGWLKMIDIYKFLISIKSCWVKRIVDTQNKGAWKLFYESLIAKVGGLFIFECSLSKTDTCIKK